LYSVSIIRFASPDSQGMKDTNGKYFEGRRGFLKEAGSSSESYDPETGRSLWEISEQIVGQGFIV